MFFIVYTTTFGHFFQSMPPTDRCYLVRDWIDKFMTHHLKSTFTNSDWTIDLPKKEGSAPKVPRTTTGGDKRKTRKYYCPPGRIIHYTPQYGMGLDASVL